MRITRIAPPLLWRAGPLTVRHSPHMFRPLSPRARQHPDVTRILPRRAEENRGVVRALRGLRDEEAGRARRSAPRAERVRQLPLRRRAPARRADAGLAVRPRLR